MCYRKNILKSNLSTERWTSSFTPFYWRIGRIEILGSSMGHIQTTITRLICVEKIQAQDVYFLKDSDCDCKFLFLQNLLSK